MDDSKAGEDEMDVGDSEDAEEDEEEEEEELSSPLGDHGSLMMALASTNVLPYEGLASPLRLTTSTGKPLNLKRGRGRPAGRAESKVKKPLGLKLKRWKTGVYMPSDKSPRHSLDGDDGASDRSPAHSSEPSTPAPATPHSEDKLFAPPPPDETSPYFTETWPGKVCVLCNLSERSQLGQGEMLRLACQEGFVPQRPLSDSPGFISPSAEPEELAGPDKSPRAPALSCRRQKNWAKCRNVVLSGQEPLDELSIVGYTEEPDIVNLFENAVSQWHVYIHENCALWSLGVSRPTDADFQTIGQIVVSACMRKCSYCGRLGASVACTFNNCQRFLHHPCSAASGAFQDSKSYSLVCNLHLDQVSLMPGLGDVTCMSCFSLGDVRNLTMCSMCGNHYHGGCVGLALLPGVRAGWQCQDCRICQICRQPEDSKVMLCETCDKAYHPHCLRPVVATIPKYGWKCKCCRVCSDCGSRTPGAGQSSRWHAHYTVCDSCYQQRNKGFSCPLCRRAYRAAAYREMVQCSKCKRFVHGTCDPDADLVTYQQRKEATPEYEYVCLNCKNEPKKRKDSIDDFCMDSSMSASQESLVLDEFDFDCEKEGYGIGKGKPFCASKIAKKKLGLGYPGPGRPGKFGKMSGITSALMMNYQKKQQRFNEFGRKRMPKAKMRGIFGVPGLGLQKPQADATKDKNQDDDTSENKLVLCSAKDKFVLTQDMCVMCGALGTDQEGCLIACVQCGQCYHPYCASVKVTKVILQKGWRCLDCTVCEGCGQRNDEARLLLCDDCDISYHIYCMNPPLTYVPRGTWKCKWCAQCLTCGASEPGVNCSWLKNYTECGPCGSRNNCPSCTQTYVDGELIIKCIQCERWIHCMCDNIQTEEEAEMCAEDGYRCMMCRPKDVKLPHLLAGALNRPPSTPTRSNSPEFTKSNEGDFYMVDGVRLSENGMYQIRALTMEQQIQPRRRKPNTKRHGSSADILATIESVIAGGNTGYTDDCNDPDEDTVEEKVYREGMPVFPRADGRPPEPPEGFTIYTTESGAMVLRRKRVRNLQKLGIGGFNARLRQTRCKDREEICDGETMTEPPALMMEDKPRRKPQRRKPKSKLAENYPSYLQEAFFGRDLLDTSKTVGQDLNSSSDEGEDKVSTDKTITLSQDELKVLDQMKIKQDEQDKKTTEKPLSHKEDDSGSDAEALKDILRLPDNLLDTDLVNTIMTETDGDIKSEENLIAESTLSDDRGTSTNSSKDELSDILGPHFNLVNMVRQTGLPNMDCKDVEEIFKGVLTDESQTSTEYTQPATNLIQSGPPHSTPSVIQSRPALQHPNMSSPITFPGTSPYHPEYSNSPQFSPVFQEPQIWGEEQQVEFNQQNLLCMEADESLGPASTIAAVLYANITHPEWKKEFPSFADRFKQISKSWRNLTQEQRLPYLQQARENKMNLRIKKTQIVKETSANSAVTASSSPKGTEVCPGEGDLHNLTEPSPVPPSTPAPVHTLVSTGSNTSPPTAKFPTAATEPQTFPTTIPSHPSTIQYIPLIPTTNPQPIRATFHLIPTKPTTTSSSEIPRTVYQYERGTIHYPPTTVQIIQSVPPLIMTSGSVISATVQTNTENTTQTESSKPRNVLQIISTQRSTTTSTSPPQSSPRQIQFSVRTEASETPPRTPSNPASSSPLSDQHIRVLTPSEIMRTLPSLGQEAYDPPPSMQEQEKLQQAKTVREAEQERQWKQLQALRQQQAQQQQQMMTDQRVQATQRVRQLTTDQVVNLPAENQTQLQTQVGSPVQVARMVTPGCIGYPRFPHTAQRAINPEMSRQLRDLLQRQQIKTKLEAERPWGQDEQGIVSPGVTDPPTLLSPASNQPQGFDTTSPATFRHPLPPSLRPGARLPLTQSGMIIRTGTPRMPTALDPRIQGVDARVRLLLQQRPGFQPTQMLRLSNPRNPLDPYDHLVQRPPFPDGSNSRQPGDVSRLASTPPSDSQRLAVGGFSKASAGDSREEIPESVTAELEKLEQEEGGPGLVEVEGVNAILGDLVEDDDELLAEMGADFNILEYADPELDKVGGGEKTNIFDVEEFEEEDSKKDAVARTEKKETAAELKPGAKQTQPDTATNPVEPTGAKNLSVTPSEPQITTSTAQTTSAQPANGGLLGQPPSGVPGVSYTPSFPAAVPQQGLTRMQHVGQVVTQQQRLQQIQRLGAPRTPVPSPITLQAQPRLPPPYPGPPPPYPGPIQQGELQFGPSFRRPLLLQEQPLLLEDLLEQEKREQEKQQAGTGATTGTVTAPGTSDTPAPQTASLTALSDADFERIRADLLGTRTPQAGVSPHSITGPGLRPPYRPPGQSPQWQQAPPTPRTITPPEPALRMPLFNVMPTPPVPPEVIVTEEDRRVQLTYENWLNSQNHAVTQQLKYCETEVQKLRKLRKSLNSKQRQQRKNGNELPENDALELQRVCTEQQGLQKQLESFRKQSRQHSILIQEYKQKQQAKGRSTGTSLHSSPSGSSPQSPGGLQLSSPGPGPINSSMSPLQQSPGIATPHSQQGDENPFSPGTPSPRPPAPPSTPHPAVVGSPGAGVVFSPQEQSPVRHAVLSSMSARFVRSPEAPPRPRVMLPTQYPATPRPAPPTDKLRMFTPQQQQQLLLQRQQLQQQRQVLLQQQQELNQEAGGLTVQQRQLQIAQQRQALQQQQEMLQQQMSEPNLSPQQRQQLQLQSRAVLQQMAELPDVARVAQRVVEGTEIARQHQIQLLQRQQQQQFNRQQMLLNQQGKVGQIQQFRQQNPQQSPSRSPMGQFGQTSPMPQHFSGTPTSPMPPQSPIQSQFTGSSPMHPQSPMISQHQPNSSPILPQSPMQNQSQFQQNTNSPHPKSPMVQPYSNQTPNSPIHPLSPRVQQGFTNQPQSPITTPQSPMVQSQNFHQTPNSPMTHHFNQPSSPRPPQSPRVQSQFQHPTSPMGAPQSPHIQQSQFVHRPNSPIRSPMPAMSPMPIRRPSSTGGSSQIEGQINFENPSPRMGHEQELNQGGGGGNPHLNPIPAPASLFGRCGFRKLGLRGGSPMWGSERPPPKRPLTGKVIKSDYEDELSRNSSQSTSKSPQKKTQSLESQEATSKNDDESTVYDDIVLVENETNLEVEELQSSLQGNVMTMPMVIDGGHLQVTEMNLGSENVEGVLDDCLVSSTNLGVLDVDRPGSGEETDCLLGMVDKDESESVQEDLLILEEDLAERESKEDESDVIEMMEESMSPPTGRKRLVGKVLPGESLKKLQEKRDSTTDTPDSPDQEEGNNDHSPDTYTSETDNEIVSTTFDRKTESVSTTTLDQSKEELKDKHENLKQVFPSVHPSASQIPPSSAHQANIGIPSLTRPSVSYPTYPRGVPRHVFPLTKPDGRSVIAVQQAAVANLVQDAVNAAKLVAEKKQYSQGVSVGQNLIPTLLSTPSTNSSIGIVSTTGTTLIAPPRMSVPFLSSARITTGSTSSNTHFMPILSQSGGLLKIEVINKKMETDDCEKNTQKQGISVAVSKQTSIPDIPEGFQKHLIDSVAQNLSRPEENRTKTEVSLGPHPSKAHSYSKILMSSNTMQSVKPSDVIEMKRSESTSQAIHSFGSDYSRHAGVISSKSSASGIQQSSVITQVSVINDVKAGQIEEASSGSSILEAQLTASSREDIQISRNSAVSSPSKTLFSFLDHMRDANKEPQCGSLNLSDMSVTYDDNKVHTEGLTLYRSSESIMSQSSISQMLKHQINSDVKLPVSVMTHLTDKQDESRVVCQPSIRRIGNLYVHSQNIKSEEVEPSDSNIRGQAKMFSTDPMQRQPKLESSPVIKTEIRTSSNISELFHQKQQFFEQKPVLSQQQDIEPINYSSSSTITSTKTVPTRLGELISGGTNAHAHIERRLSVAGQSDVESTKSQFRGQLQVDTLQQKAISSSDPNPSFLSGLQRDKEVTSQFIPLSSILTPKVEPSVTPRIADDSQNVLLKQLLQNTACATTSATASTTVNTVAVPQPERVQTIQPESSAVQPPPMLLPTSIKTQQTSPMLEPRRLSTDTQSSTLDELLSPSSPVIKREPLLTPAQIKREPSFPQSNSQLPQPMASPLPKNSPVMVEVKKEVVSSDEMISPGIRSMDPMETGSMDHSSNMPLDPQDLKKLKRRQYQQKRRQSQGKDGLTPKKRPRKSSKVEEDYDSFIDSLMAQLRQTPAMVVLEPSLGGNYMVCPIFGAGDLGKVHLNSRTGELKGSYGNATMSESDHYNTVPYGEQLPLPPQATPSTQRGFYNEEFSPLRLDTCKDDFDDRKHEFNRERETDTPDTIVSSSSPELVVPEPFIRYPGLRLIDDDSEDEERVYRRSPVIPIVIPTAIKPKDKLSSEMDKENAFRDNSLIKTRLSPSIPLKDSANVTVTLTLTSAAADDVLGVLRNLANVLRIPAPTAYHITERTVTPPSHKLGLYRTKGKDGKEGAPVDIQSILNGEAKFCRHCDVIILNNLIRKKASEMPFLTREESTEDLYFCSTVCYMQLALTHHSPAISQDKAAAVVDHLSQSDPSPVKKSKFSIDAGVKKKMKLEIKEEPTAKLEVNLQIVKKEEPSVVMKEKPKLKGVKYRVWTSNTVPPPMAKHKRLTDKEMTETLFRMGITVMPAKLPDDTRTCLFCHQVGDGVADGPARLLNYDVDKWVHLNCALWSDEVYETVNGALMNVETVLQQSLTANCCLCGRAGATLKCYKLRCSVMYHLPCAVKDQCVFYKNKTLYCNLHVPKNEKDNELTTLAVFRRVYVNRDENRQVASVMHHTEHNNVMRVGSMILLNIGQLLPHQLAAFHSQNYIYPIGYKIVRFYWSMRVSNKRCRYICSIHEANGRPEFRVLIQEPQQEDIELRDISARAVWVRVLEPLAALRKASSSVQVFPRFVSGEDLFGLTEPAIVRVLESLPGVETLTDYRFKYGRNPLLELPLAINPSGCARCEPKPRGQEKWKRAHTQRTTSAHQRTNCVAASSALGEAFSPYSKQFVHSKSSQYKKMKQEWRNNVYLARSKIQGLGLYAARDLDKHTMVIEYIGELIRTELAESREKQYEAKNRGIYMFRLDEERVVDATLSGGLARYINHSCNPNCVAETVEVERDVRIIIFAKRRISRGEELAYDYKFDIEDDQHKIPCMCGAPNCRKWMN